MRPCRTLLTLGAAGLAAAGLMLAGIAAAVAADFGEFDRMLQRYVDADAVDYAAFASDSLFAEVVERIATADLEAFTGRERLAFLLNAYNALVIQSVVDGRRPDSLLGRWRFFKRHDVTIAGRQMSLHDLEKDEILTLGDPRAHFAMTCAAVSCPPLRDEAYRAADLDEQLDDQAAGFVNSADHNRFDDEARRATVSKIFKWHRHDFGDDDADILSFLAFYVRDPSIAGALERGEYELSYMKYDWSLNGAVTE
ncbi:MAG: DUF547 domain-containing protein [Pseudomonadota bacterium]